ncbi:succinylglutamate desuccinylase/aspartoacylase family protein [Rhodocytophaga aerolata]|uniref:Succinylglutamate desuccinylase/aspartoacylase family protein n=1 Tax=Rhodocytophaga aerolata TaxID=455078 RepID=A0ABT8RAT9_9BACT|nr:succinylglutamate desuccinylase/aspartoacylase family protein [Rhodocytophaga aerolata]MDO1447867.1 succinylglutamate desuccinylase/aspartoacylase family protein [Rhodocytophaga aerolata]
MAEVDINGIKLARGKVTEVNIVISQLPSHTIIDLPVYAFRGKEDGPVLLLTAGLHGDEINGIEVIRRLIVEDALMPDKGMVIAIPLVNVYGFIYNSRNLPDGKDLNRSFPGSANGSLANRLAYILMNEVVPLVDFGVDFHTGGSRITNYPQIRCVLSNAMNRELASAFGAPYMVNSNLIDKSFRKEASKIGKTILVYEGGESLRLDEFSINQGKAGIRRLMQYLEMKNYRERPQVSVVLQQTTWLRAKISGIFNCFVEYGTTVRKNQPLANITDPYGKTKMIMKSPNDGYVIGLNNMPVVNAGDALIHLGS